MVKFFFQEVEVAMCFNPGLFQNPKGSKALGCPLLPYIFFIFKEIFNVIILKTIRT
jgi:hypothetical protein